MRSVPSTTIVIAALAIAAAPLAAPATESTPPPLEETTPDTHFEVPDGPPRLVGPPLSGDRTILPAFGPGFAPVQVNVDAFGNNFIGDAANEPSLAVDPTNPQRIVIGWRQFDTITSNFRQAGWSWSHDGGRTWTFPGVIEPGIFRSDPVLDVDVDGNFYYNSLTSGGGGFSCDVFRSTDGGVTWGPGVPAFGGDKQWMVIDRTNGVGQGNIYANWTLFFSACQGQATRSYDGGLSYLDCFDVTDQPQWGTMAVGPDGTLYIAGRGFVVARSSTIQNQGAPPNFQSAFVNLGGQIAFGGDPNPGGLLGQAWVQVDHSGGPTHGNVYLLCSVDPGGSDPLDVRFSRSTDGGVSWSPATTVNDEPPGTDAWQWFGTMSVAPNGRIDAVWYDSRAGGPSALDSALHYSFSDDAGVSWATSVTVSSTFNSVIGWPDQSKIGDYIGMTSDLVGANVAFSATFNGEQDVYFLRINDYDCNGNGVGDAIDLASGTGADCNGNGIPDECEGGSVCLADINNDCTVNVFDLLAVLSAWGPCPGCPQDITGDNVVNVFDLLEVLAAWGSCS